MCIFFASNNSIQISTITSNSTLSPSNFTLTVPITLSSNVKAYNLTVNTLANYALVDTGIFSLTTIARKLINN
jgi:hypothetical protein